MNLCRKWCHSKIERKCAIASQAFITRSAPEVALVTWQVRDSPAVKQIQDDTGIVCDHCGRRLDWEPFAVIDLPSDEELQDPEYVSVGGTALCKACAMKFYHLTQQDVGEVDRVWLCYECVEHKTR